MAGDGARIRACLAMALLSLGLAVALGRAESPQKPIPASSPTVQVHGEPLVVPVSGGVADFRLRRPGNGRVLIVASALARAGGPFAISLRTEAADREDRLPRWEPPRFASECATSETPPGFDADPYAKPTVQAPDSREFWLPVRPGVPSDAKRYVPILARRIQVGHYIQVYVDARDQERVDPALAAFLVAAFDGEVLPRSAARWGTARDVDGDGRFTVLLTSWLGHLKRRGEPVEGCFRGADMDCGLAPPFGNRCDMVSLDARLAAGPHAKTILIHEYAHAIVFTRKALSDPNILKAVEDEAGWLDEAMAHLVEDDHAPGGWNSNLDRRLASYRAAPEAFPLVLPDEPVDGAAFASGGGNRGAAALFLRWCAGEASDRDRLLRRLARPGARGVANVERATGVPFPELFRGWSVAQFRTPEAIDGDRPAAATVSVGGRVHQWIAQPTSSHYVVVDSEEATPFLRVRIEAPPGAELQVTAVPLEAIAPAVAAGKATNSRSD